MILLAVLLVALWVALALWLAVEVITGWAKAEHETNDTSRGTGRLG